MGGQSPPATMIRHPATIIHPRSAAANTAPLLHIRPHAPLQNDDLTLRHLDGTGFDGLLEALGFFEVDVGGTFFAVDLDALHGAEGGEGLGE